MKSLVLVESPTKARKIQEYLGENYIVISSNGHICDLAKGGKFGIGVNIEDNFKPYYLLMKDKIQILDDIINASEKCDQIYLASDQDREGEYISYHLKTRLETTKKPISRVDFVEITKNAILESLKNKRSIDLNLCKAAEARRILDRIIGFMVSPFLINFYGPNLSAGRVQSVAVRMIVDREQEIESFKPEEYWNIHAKFSTKNNESFLAKANICLKNKNEAEAFVKSVKDQDEFFVSKVVSQQKKEKPCAPLTTASLQQYVSKKYHLDPDTTMKIAQNLYENGFCTYIRTDSTRIADEAVKSVRSWIKENKFDVPTKPNIYASKSSAQDAHECIRPTNVNNIPDSSILTGDERSVYRAIWQHFVASQMNPAVWKTIQVRVCASNNKKILFTTSGKALEYKGYLEIFGDIEPGKIDIPNLQEKDLIKLFNNNSIKSEQKFTKPPARYNDASIIGELEGKQIGRPATYAEIIKKISNRNYVEKQGSVYKPTELGKKITSILINSFPFMEYKYTASLEKQLDEIASGSLDYLKMLKEFFYPFKAQLTQAYTKNGSTICEKCGAPMITRTNSKDQTKFISCSAYPKCFNTKKAA